MADDALSPGAVARRLGVAVTTLRTWHQRYGLGPNRHTPGHHRRYTPEDLARLEIMRRLTAEGVTPAEAARWAQRAPGVPDIGSSWQRPVPLQSDGASPCDGAGPTTRGLTRAAMRLDSAGMRETVIRAIATGGVVATWDILLRPVLAEIGERHATTGDFIEVEHLISRCVSEVFATVARPPAGAGSSRILLSCADEEQHSLPLEALAAALAQVGVACRQLGARVPVAALIKAVSRTDPIAVVVWSQRQVTASPAHLIELLGAARRPLLLLAAGPGWDADPLPAGVLRPASLAEAVSLVVSVRESLGQPAAG